MGRVEYARKFRRRAEKGHIPRKARQRVVCSKDTAERVISQPRGNVFNDGLNLPVVNSPLIRSVVVDHALVWKRRILRRIVEVHERISSIVQCGTGVIPTLQQRAEDCVLYPVRSYRYGFSS